MALCVIGIALYAIPVGVIFDAFQHTLQENWKKDEAAEAEAKTDAKTIET